MSADVYGDDTEYKEMLKAITTNGKLDRKNIIRTH